MPAYQGTGKAVLLRDNQQRWMYQQEQPAAGTASAAFQLERINRSFYPWGASFEVFFTDVNGNPVSPGTFEIDIQTADIDMDSHYCTINQITSSNLNANYVGRLELPNFFAKFVRAFVKTFSGGSYVSVLVTR